MNTARLESIGFARSPSGDEWGIEGNGVALTFFPDERDASARWYVRPRLDGGGVAIPSPPDEATLLVLMVGLGLRTPDDAWQTFLTTQECVLV